MMDRKPGHLPRNVQTVSQSLMWIKLVGIGNSCCGKTCLIKHFCESKFNQGYQPTVGVDYGFKIQNIKGLDLRVHLWDLSGQSEYLDVRNELYSQTDAVFLVFDITNQASFENLDQWLREIVKYAMGHVAPEIVVVGNKVDLKSKRVVSLTEAKKWASSHKLLYYETSALTGEGIEKMFHELLERVISKKHNIKIPS
ncbi:dnaJ homolog subfamily C member 27-like [Tubulanus polymorphus]|uniref:dnaJ homolog subfamily C member 27-like n=1 Tax=Tubulanus polymorphus TaxID=672921 RepID=UPI003DA53533